jgi:cytochrome oxidase Cu insertion factor (SCO1/SenC/PrrC family)
MKFSSILFIAVVVFIVSMAHAFQLSSSNVMRRSPAHALSLEMLKVGEAAPDFELKNAQGKIIKLSSFKGKKPVVVFFYPADNSPGCTKEVSLCLFFPWLGRRSSHSYSHLA